jgi:hypothetical protein
MAVIQKFMWELTINETAVTPESMVEIAVIEEANWPRRLLRRSTRICRKWLSPRSSRERWLSLRSSRRRFGCHSDVWDMAVLEEFMRWRRLSLRRWCGIDKFQKNLMRDEGVVRLSRIPVLEKSVIEALMENSWLFKTDLISRWSVPLRSYCDLPWRRQSLLIGDVHT